MIGFLYQVQKIVQKILALVLVSEYQHCDWKTDTTDHIGECDESTCLVIISFQHTTFNQKETVV